LWIPSPFLSKRKFVSASSTTVISYLERLWAKADGSAVRAFFLSITALGVALLLALYSSAAAQLGRVGLASASALVALAVAGWVAVTLVPVLAKRTPLRWIGHKMDYKITREGWIYAGGILVVALAALNTGNNLLFLILATLLGAILISGILSSVTLMGVSLSLDLPEHIFAKQLVRGQVELRNEKSTLPSFSLRVEPVTDKNCSSSAILETPVYFPYIGKHDRLKLSVPITFPRRGVYRQEAFRIVTRFPFGFLQKSRQLNLPTDAIVYPSVEPLHELLEILPGLQGALESVAKGRGQDLYALRGYVPTDSARHVHWKASARLGSLMVREFTREDDCRVLLVLDPHTTVPAETFSSTSSSETFLRFERAVTLCAGLAWHFYERNALLQFRSAGVETALVPAKENIFDVLRYLALAKPLAADPTHALLSELAAEPELFKVIVTSQARGSISASLWQSSYVIFLEDLDSDSAAASR
jgi:uncharacterized protein (DUF58 family)